MPKKQKKTKEVVPEIPKKKKKNKRMYFDQDVQDAIVRYNDLDPIKDQSKRNRIYGQEIHAAFDKLSENIINTFKFSYFDYGFEEVKNEVVSFMVMNIHKYDHTKGSKAFSYFSVVAKNYLILHNNANYKRYKTHDDIDSTIMRKGTSSKGLITGPDPTYYNNFIHELIRYFEYNIPILFSKKRDINIAFSIVELLSKTDEIENFNKKALYVLIREMTNIETSYITKVVNVFKKEYKYLINEFETTGVIAKHKKSKFFK